MTNQRRLQRLLLALVALTLLVLLTFPALAAEIPNTISPAFLQIRNYIPEIPATPSLMIPAEPTPIPPQKSGVEEELLSLTIPQSSPPQNTVLIPTIGLSSIIEEVGYTTIGNAKTWAVPQNTVGTPEDAIKNNLILIGHTGSYSSVFGKVSHVSIGALVQVTQENIIATYQVTENVTVDVHDLSYIFSPKSPRVTIITCVNNHPSLRRIVVAEKIE